MATVATKPMTVDEFEAIGDRLRVELVAGEILELPMPGAKHGALCFWLAYLLHQWAEIHGEGFVLTNDTFVLTETDPDSVRGADVLYIRKDRLPNGVLPEGTLRVPPNLVVEVQSPSDRPNDVTDKVFEYLAAGVREVWVVNGTKRLVDVYRPDTGPKRFTNADTISSADVLTGFACPVAEIFRNV
jgi:Uma2 family endonuclease